VAAEEPFAGHQLGSQLIEPITELRALLVVRGLEALTGRFELVALSLLGGTAVLDDPLHLSPGLVRIDVQVPPSALTQLLGFLFGSPDGRLGGGVRGHQCLLDRSLGRFGFCDLGIRNLDAGAQFGEFVVLGLEGLGDTPEQIVDLGGGVAAHGLSKFDLDDVLRAE